MIGARRQQGMNFDDAGDDEQMEDTMGNYDMMADSAEGSGSDEDEMEVDEEVEIDDDADSDSDSDEEDMSSDDDDSGVTEDIDEEASDGESEADEDSSGDSQDDAIDEDFDDEAQEAEAVSWDEEMTISWRDQSKMKEPTRAAVPLDKENLKWTRVGLELSLTDLEACLPVALAEHLEERIFRHEH
jgi:hypothetical protein